MPLSKIDSDSLNSGAVTSAAIAAGSVASTALASGVPTRAQLPAGTVLQVVSNTYKSSDAYALANTFQQATSLNTSITPTSASSKVLIRVVIYIGETGAGSYTGFRLTKDGSEIVAARGETNGSRKLLSGAAGALSTNSDYQCICAEYLDSPATTSSVTYGVQVTGFNSRTFYINITGNGDANAGVSSASSMTLMEIAA